MTDQELEHEVRAIDHEYGSAHDGGYGAVKVLLCFAEQRTPDERSRLGSVLLRLVETKDESLWGICLECLTRGWPRESAERLARLCDRLEPQDERTAHIVLALVQMRHMPFAPNAVSWAEQRVKAGDLSVLPTVAALVHLDTESCMRLTTEAFKSIADDHRRKRIRAYIPAVVLNFIESDPVLLARLVESVTRENTMSGMAFGAEILDELGKPWRRSCLSPEQRELLQGQIRAAMTTK